MQKPITLGKREPFNKGKITEDIILKETFLRRTAYANAIIKTGESFYDDSDMQSDYYLVIVYDKKTNTPLLSARYYFDKEVIANYLQGDENQEPNEYNNEVCQTLSTYKEGELFLADRLSGNTANPIYKLHRNYIFLVFYLAVLKHNNHRSFIIMARKEKHERLLTKYLRLGLHVVGSTKLRGKEHWIVLGDIRKIYTQQKLATLANIIMILKVTFNKRK